MGSFTILTKRLTVILNRRGEYMHFKELLEDGFKRVGNWYIKDHISVNLMSKTIRCTKVKFDIDFADRYVTLEQINNLSKAILDIS